MLCKSQGDMFYETEWGIWAGYSQVELASLIPKLGDKRASSFNRDFRVQRVPASHAFWDLEKTVLHEILVSGTLLWSPFKATSPTCMYISQKPW